MIPRIIHQASGLLTPEEASVLGVISIAEAWRSTKCEPGKSSRFQVPDKQWCRVEVTIDSPIVGLTF